MSTPVCPYCGNYAYMITGKDIYPDLPKIEKHVFWKCQPCFAWVGCHPGTIIPLGSLANRELRKARQAAHRQFDYIPVKTGISRSDCYKWLAKTLGIPRTECHIGMFNIEQCGVVVQCALFLLNDDDLIEQLKQETRK